MKKNNLMIKFIKYIQGLIIYYKSKKIWKIKFSYMDLKHIVTKCHEDQYMPYKIKF